MIDKTTEIQHTRSSKEIEFANNRKNLVVEVGPGGPATMNYPEVQKYLKKQDANYLGIDENAFAVDLAKGYESEYDWVHVQRGDFLELDGYKNKIDEIWIFNFMTGYKPPTWEHEFIGKIFGTLKPGGFVVIANDYDNISEEEQERLKREFSSKGFEVENIDLSREDHPFISGRRNLDAKFGTDPEEFGRGKLAFKAVKS